MFTVVEMQDNGEQVGVLTYSYENENDANEKYYLVLAAAAQSQVMYHSAFMVRDGFMQKCDRISHYEPPEPHDNTEG